MRIDLKEGEKLYICDFCGMSSEADAHFIVARNGATCICEECAKSAAQFINETKASKEAA
ncbi:ClpX C4-type zinc finger protein [Delftia deserti]|uniref:ClpX C4-type zinc finger protein n=1 Tax=Delftia deserti TaxID=1651218 RepID=UPI003613B700